MFAKKSALPEARIVPVPRWYLNDRIFLSEIGGTLAFFGLLMMMLVMIQRDTGEIEKDPFAAQALPIVILMCYGLSVAGLSLAIERLWKKGERPKTYLQSLGTLVASSAPAIVAVGFAVYGITRLLLPLQMFFAWLAMSAGFTLIMVMRQRQKAAEKKLSDEIRPVE